MMSILKLKIIRHNHENDETFAITVINNRLKTFENYKQTEITGVNTCNEI